MSGSGPVLSFVPSREQLDALLLRREGELRDAPYRLLLLAIALREKSAVLTLRRGPLEKEVFFDAGVAVDCQSNIATETLGRFLVSSGRLPENDFREALSTSAARGMHIEEVLTERNLISATELYRALQQNLGRKLLEPFNWTSGSWRISYDVPPVESALRVRVPQLLVTGIAKIEPPETIEEAIAEVGAQKLSLGAAPLFDPLELRLSSDQQRILEVLRRGATIDDLRSASQSIEDLHRFVYALLLAGVAAPGEAATVAAPPVARPQAPVPFFELDLPQEEARRPAPPVATAAPQTATPLSAAPANVSTSDEVLATWLACRRKDSFELLGVEPTSGAMDITRAFLDASERFRPTLFDERDGLREKAQEVFLAMARAYAELADPVRRQALIDRRNQKKELGESKRIADAQVARAAAAPRRTVIDPEDLHRQGRAAAAAGKLREALGFFEMAADCDAQNGTYAAEVAYTRFQLMISPAATTLKLLKNAIRIDPRCAVAYLYAGKVQEALGNNLEAQAYLGRATKLGARL